MLVRSVKIICNKLLIRIYLIFKIFHLYVNFKIGIEYHILIDKSELNPNWKVFMALFN